MNHDQEDAAKEIARKLSSYVNGWHNHVDSIVNELGKDHRTLQQGVTNFCVKWLEECARKEKENLYDLRNEASVKLGKKFMEVTDARDRALPFI